MRSWEVPAAGGGRGRRYYELTLKGGAASGVHPKTLVDLLGPRGEDPRAAAIARMRDRLRQGAAVSAFVLDLRRRLLEAGYDGG